MMIRDVMEQTQLSKKAIRYYEEKELFETSRCENGYKDYSTENIDKLISIRKLRDLGFSIEEIRSFFASEEDKTTVLSEKLNDVEKKLSLLSKERDLLNSLNSGKAIESINLASILAREDPPYIYIRNINKVFGLFNLIAFLAITIYFLFFKAKTVQTGSVSLFILWILSLSLLSIYEERRGKLRKQGVVVLERKVGEMVLRYAVFIGCYIMSGAIANECLNAIKWYIAEADYWMIGNSILVILIFMSVCVIGVIASFFDDTLELINFFKKPGR